MVAKLLYTKDAPHQRDVEHLAGELEKLRVEYKLVEADSVEGQSLTELYNLTSRPAAVVTTSDGVLVKSWNGRLPVAENISGITHS